MEKSFESVFSRYFKMAKLRFIIPTFKGIGVRIGVENAKKTQHRG